MNFFCCADAVGKVSIEIVDHNKGAAMKNMDKFLLLSAVFMFCLILSPGARADTISGKWKTIDDETNEPKSIVRIYEQDGKYSGLIEMLFRKPGENPDPVCDKCPDDDPRKNQPIKGMVIIKDLAENNGEFSGGTILDAGNGKIYKCKLWVEDGKLMVRGYIGFFFRTQTWLKAE